MCFCWKRSSGPANYQVQLVAATSRDIRATLQTYLPDDKVFVIDDIIEDVKPEEFTLIEAAKVEDITSVEQAAGDSPVIKLVNYAIYTAVRDGRERYSHRARRRDLLRIRYRVDGRLVEKLRPPHLMSAAVFHRASRSWPGWIFPSADCPRTAAFT